jgi:hypothetical protein
MHGPVTGSVYCVLDLCTAVLDLVGLVQLYCVHVEPVLDLCTGSVYCVLCTGSSCRSCGRRAFRPRRRVVLNLCTVYCVLCTVYWICVLDLCTVYCVLCTVYWICVLDLCTVYCVRVRRPRRRVAARCVLDLCTVYCVLDLAVFVLSPVRCVRAYSTVCRAVLHVGATRRPARCSTSTSYVRRVGQVDRVPRRTTRRCDASTS